MLNVVVIEQMIMMRVFDLCVFVYEGNSTGSFEESIVGMSSNGKIGNTSIDGDNLDPIIE